MPRLGGRGPASHILQSCLVLATLAAKYRRLGQDGFPSKVMLMILKERFLRKNDVSNHLTSAYLRYVEISRRFTSHFHVESLVRSGQVRSYQNYKKYNTTVPDTHIIPGAANVVF